MSKKVIILFCALLLLLEGCGNVSGDNINTQALRYMERKYGETFEYSAPTGSSLSGTHALFVRCQSLPEAVYVEIENYQKANRVFLDNYIAVKYKQDTIDFLVECATTEFEKANVFYSVSRSGLSPELPVDANFTDFLEKSGATLIGTIEVKAEEDSYKEKVERLAQQIDDSGVQYRLMIAVMTPDEFGIYDKDKLGDMVVLGKTKNSASISNKDGNIDVRWDREEG